MKNLVSTSSCSSRRENQNTKCSVGCMSGIFSLFSNYNRRLRRKSLTSGRERGEKNSPCAARQTEEHSQTESRKSRLRKEEVGEEVEEEKSVQVRLVCSEVQRSPTLPAEIRCSMDSDDDVAVAADKKRKQLVGALEKCDRDLKALQNIIDAVKVAVGVDRRTHDHLLQCRQTPRSIMMSYMPNAAPNYCVKLQSHHHHYFSSHAKSNQYDFIHGVVVQQQQQKDAGEEDDECDSDKWVENARRMRGKAMVDCVNEVCKDMAWGERREIGRVGLALQHHIFKDLIQEFLTDLTVTTTTTTTNSLPFDACRRRLSF